MSAEQKCNFNAQNKARVCIYSQRHLQQLLSACSEYEFEDVICELDGVDVLSPQPSRLFEIRRRFANQLSRRAAIVSFNPGVREIRFDRDYDLFLAKFMLQKDLLSLNAVRDWRKHCRTAICWLAETWVSNLSHWKGYAKILSQFDYVILNCRTSVQPVQDMINKPCFYLPTGVDAIKFCPYPNPPLRSVDVYSIGRKSQVTHRALLKMAEQKRIFYLYDTIIRKETAQPAEHRSLIANIAKRSRYFLVNPAKIDRGFETCGQNEIGFRYFEGAAAGTVMIGEHPETEVFREHFGWPDSVIRVPFDTPVITDILAELDSQPERIAKARKNNIVQSLLRHDWAYRWNTILNIAGLKPSAALTQRLEYLKKLAEEIKSDSAVPNQSQGSDNKHNTFIETGS